MNERLRTTVRLAWHSVVVLGLLSFAVLRCAPPDQCLRISDCARGMTCLDGDCVPADGDPSAETTATDAASSVTDASSNAVTKDASTGSSPDASGADAADSGSSDVETPDAGDEEDLTDF
ncbi:hypothetical protein AKJ09_01335 [Labilithrix luteola]|uniref:Uncharacterized protein n=1 Tax=Labilithrix luteola TaxID=1391654 RepID=A0A0K1PMN6_9BACT|nr:hypothetical protein [Labilithrix luteola]AKU94671.1 hypothetical protein AKJ09_01335 [Labilithrix luteola]